MIDHQLIEGVTLHHSEWRRECPRCSCIEKSRFEPEEARIKRIEREKIESAQRAEQAKKERIKELRKELRKLERNNK